ncbi:MAG: glycosyltransferase family 2 protein [Haloferacaceae archaeon]
MDRKFTVVDLVGVVLVVFVFTQSVYGLVNLLSVPLVHLREPNLVEADPADAPDRVVRVLIPAVDEDRAVVTETLQSLYDADYPSDLIYVYLVYEPDDPTVTEYVDDLVTLQRDLGRDVTAVQVDRRTLATHIDSGPSLLPPERTPETKASALVYAFTTLTFNPDDVVTVFDADTTAPPDLLPLAVAGLETYDFVQAKQTVRNVFEGALPFLEAMGIAAWCDTIYERSSRGPYQLLGKAYFTSARTLHDLGGWQADAVTEDMTLGLAASARGYRLGIVDRYVYDLCPAEIGAWLRQKRRWARGPYGHLFDSGFDRGGRLRLWTYTVANQIVSVTNLAGLPAGIAMVVLTVVGLAPPFSAPLAALVAFNLGAWIYYSVQSYRAAWAAVPVESVERWVYMLVSNPFTQLFYSTVWAIPVLVAAADAVRGRDPEFVVTPKPTGRERNSESPAAGTAEDD